MQPQEDQDRNLTFPVDVFTQRGPSIPDGAPFDVAEFMRYITAYKQFLDSIRKLELTFLNGKSTPISYSFDATRPEEDRLLINWDWLAPLFWSLPPGDRDFVRLSTILEFVRRKRLFRKCKVLANDTCSCRENRNAVVSSGQECRNELHWHHFCAAHVHAWLTKYMVPAILLVESKEMFREMIAREHKADPEILKYYSTDDHTDTEVLLNSARSIGGPDGGAACNIS